MHGNVSEWCNDFFGFLYGEETDPKGPATGKDRVVRGGCFKYEGSQCRSAVRGLLAPINRYNDLGFRLVRTP